MARSDPVGSPKPDAEQYGERHKPIEEGSKVWLKLRPDGHSAWSSDWLNYGV